MAELKILVIDDNPVVLKLDESLLRSVGYEVITASDGIEGIKKAREERPDIILLDIILPGMHGFEVCKKLKEDETTKVIPVIIVTGAGLEEVARNEPDIQAEGYIAKPYGLEELEAAIQGALKKH